MDFFVSGSYLFLMIYRMIDINKIQKMKYNYLKLITVFAAMVLMCYLCWLQTRFSSIVNVIIGAVVFVVPNKEIIRSFGKAVTGKIRR